MPSLGPAREKPQTKSVTENYNNIIDKAQNLALQKNRSQALLILNSAIHKEAKSLAALELESVANEISEVFFSDKAQEIYETALTLRAKNINQAIDKIQQALKIEPDNFTLLLEQGRLLLARKDCKNALEIADLALGMLPTSELASLLKAQSFACQNKWEDFEILYKELNSKKLEYSIFWSVLEFTKNIEHNALLKAQEILNQIVKKDENYPEIAYLKWKLSLAKQRPQLEVAQRYINQCTNISLNHNRKYLFDSMLCRHLEIVENELKGNLNGIK